MAQKSGRCDLRVNEYTASLAQAIFRRRRHQPSRPPHAKISPGSPAPAIGPGTGVGPVHAPGLSRTEPELPVNRSFATSVNDNPIW